MNKILNETKYQEIITTIGDLKEGDQVMGTDGKWHEIEILPIHTPERMFEIIFKEKDNNFGLIKCSGDHLWTLFNPITKQAITLETKIIYENIKYLYLHCIGEIEGPTIESINEIEPIPSRCISLKDSKDMLFEVILEEIDLSNNEEIDDFEFEVERKV